MLVRAGDVAVCRDERVRSVGAGPRLGVPGEQSHGALAQLDRGAVPAPQVTEAALHQHRIGGCDRMLLRVEHGARVLQVRQPALIAHGNERRRGLALQPRTHDGVCRLGQGAFEVLERGEAVAGELADAAHLLFERQLLVGEPERLRALERAAIRRQRLVVREHPLGLGAAWRA